MNRLALVGVLGLGWGACAAPPPVVTWGRECEASRDPEHRLELVRKIMATGDERSIPVLIDCLAAAKDMGKGPDRQYAARTVVPNDTAPPEFWGLYILTQKDFDLDVDKWRRWYEGNRGRFQWDGATRRFYLP
jgi:hypothetical protein